MQAKSNIIILHVDTWYFMDHWIFRTFYHWKRWHIQKFNIFIIDPLENMHVALPWSRCRSSCASAARWPRRTCCSPSLRTPGYSTAAAAPLSPVAAPSAPRPCWQKEHTPCYDICLSYSARLGGSVGRSVGRWVGGWVAGWVAGWLAGWWVGRCVCVLIFSVGFTFH